MFLVANLDKCGFVKFHFLSSSSPESVFLEVARALPAILNHVLSILWNTDTNILRKHLRTFFFQKCIFLFVVQSWTPYIKWCIRSYGEYQQRTNPPLGGLCHWKISIFLIIISLIIFVIFNYKFRNSEDGK